MDIKMNKRIKKKIEIRKCEKSLKKFKKIFRQGYGNTQAKREWIKGFEFMYSRRIAAIRKRYDCKQATSK